MKTIVINATAARASGALTILKDFVAYVQTLKENIFIFHLLTTTNGIFQNSENVLIHEIPVQSWSTRLLWDRCGFQKWCIHNKIIPDVVISFQNTCPRLIYNYRNVKLLVYYHQPLPLVKYKWKLRWKDERKLFLYANLYGFFVNRWNKNADYVVQLPYIKQLFCKKFKNINHDRVHVIRPNLPKIDINAISRKEIDDTKKIFLYPAIPVRYKNHKVILDAVEKLLNEDIEISDKFEIFFTVPENSVIAGEIIERNLDSFIKCIGSIPYEELLTYYKRCNALLFPSEIETFGLPLIEAAMFGKPIIAADLPYAREVLENYEGAIFLNSKDAKNWSNIIKQIINSDRIYTPLQCNSDNTWKSILDLI